MTELPPPPVPAECDLTDFKFMPLDVARLRDSNLASDETPASCWAAVLLWSAAWHQIPSGSLPNDDRWIAKAAGYASRGRIDREWAEVRTGALRGFMQCSDGRLYHPVVAEKAREAWEAKRDQRWRSECARIKKHNDRHPGANVPKPTFDEWVSQGCPQGQRLHVPGDTSQKAGDIPGDTDSKGQGEGQGQGQGQGQIHNPSGEGGKPPVENPPPPSPTDRERLFSEGVPLLTVAGVSEKNARSMLAGLAKRSSDAAVVRAIERCARENPVEPVSWLQTILAPAMTGSARAPASGANRFTAGAAAIFDGADHV